VEMWYKPWVFRTSTRREVWGRGELAGVWPATCCNRCLKGQSVAPPYHVCKDGAQVQLTAQTCHFCRSHNSANTCFHCFHQWREAQALVLAPHTFEVLRQLPELQQIISFTAVKVVQAAGAPGWHLNTADNTSHHLRPPSCATSAEVLQAMRECPEMRQHTASISGPMACLFDTLSPHMRLTLAAEVAAGMLCPG